MHLPAYPHIHIWELPGMCSLLDYSLRHAGRQVLYH